MKGFILSIAAFLSILLVLNLGSYRTWFISKPKQYWADFLKEKDDTIRDLTLRAQR